MKARIMSLKESLWFFMPVTKASNTNLKEQGRRVRELRLCLTLSVSSWLSGRLRWSSKKTWCNPSGQLHVRRLCYQSLARLKTSAWFSILPSGTVFNLRCLVQLHANTDIDLVSVYFPEIMEFEKVAASVVCKEANMGEGVINPSGKNESAEL